MTKKQIEAALEKLAKKREELHAELKKVNAKVLVECVSNCYGKGCGKKTSVGKLTYIATYYYDNEPYCEGWVEGEGQFDCPRCGHRNRIIDESLGGVGERIKALRDVFKKTVKSHDDSHPPLSSMRTNMGYQNPIFKAEYERAIAMAPSLRIVPKESSWLMRLIAPVMKIINPTWMTNYTTTLGSTLYMPGSEIDTYSGASVLCHEAVHIQQWRRWWILMALSYALLLPVVFTMRAYWEFYGYVESLRFIQRQGRVFDSDIEWAVSQFTSAAYGWMFPFPNYLRRKFREHLGIL